MIILGTVIFVVTYLAIAFEKQIKIDKTASALAGAVLMLLTVLKEYGQNTGHSQFSAWNQYADFDVIFLLAGMMVIVNTLRESGIFQYVAIKCAKLGKGRPLPILALLLFATAFLSAFLDNVTTVLLMAPVTLLVAAELKLNPVPFLIPEILASNIGGTATLIGDPPNILVGSTANKIFAYNSDINFDFVAFLKVMSPAVIVIMVVFVIIIMLRLNGKMNVTAEERARIMELDEIAAISSKRLMVIGLVIMGITLLGFMLHSVIHVEPGVVAMGGAAMMLIATRADVEESLAKVEWTTLFFFIGLFVVVQGASQIGILKFLGSKLAELIGNPAAIAYIAPITVLWLSGIFAGLMNNVSFTLAALPVIEALAESFYGLGSTGAIPLQAESMYWALALGSCFGGNLTPVGAAANLVVINIAEKNNHEISWGRYLKWGLPTAFGSLLLSTGYICIFVYMHHPF